MDKNIQNFWKKTSSIILIFFPKFAESHTIELHARDEECFQIHREINLKSSSKRIKFTKSIETYFPYANDEGER